MSLWLCETISVVEEECHSWKNCFWKPGGLISSHDWCAEWPSAWKDVSFFEVPEFHTTLIGTMKPEMVKVVYQCL